MPELARVTASLRILGDTLVPEEVTRLLGIEPTACARKGDVVRSTVRGRKVMALCGSWRLEADGPGDLDECIDALLAKLPDDPSVWRSLSGRYRCDVFCGLFTREGNEGTTLRPTLLSRLGERGLHLGLDIYAGLDRPENTSVDPPRADPLWMEEESR